MVLPAYGVPLVSKAPTVKLIGTPLGEPALGGLICSAEGTALRATSEKLAEAPAASEPGLPPVTYWSHSTPPALSTCSPTTLSSKVGASAAAALLILPHTSLSALPNASAW